MFTKDVRFDGFTTEDWARLVAVWKRSSESGQQAPRGGLLVIHDGVRVRKLLHTTQGRLDKEGEVWPSSLAPLAAKHNARWVLAAPTGGLEQLAERFGERARQKDDLSAQVRSFLEILRELLAEGVLELWPNHLERLFLPPLPMFENTFEAVFPPGHLILLVLFHRGELWTSIALERGQEGIARIIGPDELRPRVSFLSGDFRRDYRYVLEAARETLGPVALGLFSELSIFRTLHNEKSWSAWLRAVAVRDVVLTPPKGPLATSLAADAAVWIAALTNSLGKRWDSLGLMLSVWRRWR
jgi:hypothetical protein